MDECLILYLRWLDSLLSAPSCTLQAKIIIYDTLRIFYNDVRTNLAEEILSTDKHCLEATSKFYMLVFNFLTGAVKKPSCYKRYVNASLFIETFEKNDELVTLYRISCNKRKFKTNCSLTDKNIHKLEARMLLEYERGNIERGNLIFRILTNFGDICNPVMDSVYRKLLSKQNPIGFWGAYSKSKFTNKEIESLLNIGFGTLSTLKEYKESDFCLF